MSSHVMPTYFNQFPVAFERGEGVWLWDTEGRKYLDALSGIGVCSLGHAHPAVTQVIIEQAHKVLHTSNTFRIPHQEKLADKLCEISGMEQVYFCNSGAEANETAIKLTRLFARNKKIQNPTVITLLNSFHGRTFATLCATGSERIQQGFEPLMSEFVHLHLNDLVALEKSVRDDKNMVAILFECVQGDGGIHSVTSEYIQKIRQLCDEHDLLMIVDEVQTGIGRTGEWFAYQHDTVLPDIVTSAKALGNGIPIGACMVRGKACNLFGPGKHGSTFGGNPFACAVGWVVINAIENDNVLTHVRYIGDYLKIRLIEAFKQYPCIVDVRGKGLMIGLELNCQAFDIVPIGIRHGLLFNVVANNVIRILPPLILSQIEADEIVSRLQIIVDEFCLLKVATSEI